MYISYALSCNPFGLRLPPVAQAAPIPVSRRILSHAHPWQLKELSAISCNVPLIVVPTTLLCGYSDRLTLIFLPVFIFILWFQIVPSSGMFL